MQLEISYKNNLLQNKSTWLHWFWHNEASVFLRIVQVYSVPWTSAQVLHVHPGRLPPTDTQDPQAELSFNQAMQRRNS